MPNFSVEIDFIMTPFFTESNPLVWDNCGKMALCYGPTVYCLESLDNPYELHALSVSCTANCIATDNPSYSLPDFLVNGYVDEDFDCLYRKATTHKKQIQLRFKPYYTFANREECDMLVWIRKYNESQNH